jgi:hypothetical protein
MPDPDRKHHCRLDAAWPGRRRATRPNKARTDPRSVSAPRSQQLRRRDAIRKAHSATATVFVKDGDEFVRVSTNVLTPEGKRGVGTQLAHNAAYAAVSTGKQYCGPIDVLGTAFDACYNPIKDAGGKIIGVSYIGHKK